MIALPHRRTVSITMVACAAAAVGAGSAASWGQLIRELRPITGYAQSTAQSIDASGVVVGYSSGTADLPTVWRPTPSGYVADPLPLPPGTLSGGANAIAAGGLIIGYAQPEDTDIASPVVWTPAPGGGYTATPLPAPPLSNFAGAYSINASGQVAGFATFANGTTRAVVWSPVGGGYPAATVLPGVPNETESNATVITDAGLVGGYSIVPSFVSGQSLAATFWEPGAGGSYTPKRATAVDISDVVAFNANGLGAGVLRDQPGAVAFYDGDYYVGELPMPNGSSGGEANAINSLDFIVGAARDGETATPGFEAAMWVPTENYWDFLNLDRWLNENDGGGAAWVLNMASAVNDGGLVAGNGVLGTGAAALQRAYVLDASALVPEPGAVAVLFLLPLLARPRRSQRASDDPSNQNGFPSPSTPV